MASKLISTIQTLEKKYFDLVWYARKPPTEDLEYWDALPPSIRKQALIAVFTVEATWPEDCAELADPDSGDWQHGFNSGMLAGMRYLLSVIEYGKKQADNNFPELET